jgi:hypothetical protein
MQSSCASQSTMTFGFHVFFICSHLLLFFFILNLKMTKCCVSSCSGLSVIIIQSENLHVCVCVYIYIYEGYPRSNAQSDVVSKHFIFKLHLH